MKKLISCFLCFVFLICAVLPAAHAEENLSASMTAYFDTDRGTVLVLYLDERVTGVSQDSFSVRIQKLKRGEERFGFDIASENIAVREPRDAHDFWKVYLLDFEDKLCTHVRVEGLLTDNGEQTLTQSFCAYNNKLINNRLTAPFVRDLQLVDYDWTDRTVAPDWLTDDEGIGIRPGDGKEFYCFEGDQIALYYEYGHLTPSFSSVRIDGDILTQNDDGSFTANALGDCMLHAELSELITYTWTIHVVTEQEFKNACLRAVKQAPLEFMAKYVAGATLLFSMPFPLLTILLPVIVPFAVLTAPAAYLVFLAWIRFSK